MNEHQEKAIEIIGGQAKTAEKLSHLRREIIYQPKIHYWLKVSKNGGIPPEYCPDIEKLSGVPREKLRPDVDWGRKKKKGRGS